MFNPFSFVKKYKAMILQNTEYRMRTNHKATRLQSFNGVSVGDLIAVLKEHGLDKGMDAPVQIELVTEKEVVYKSVFDVVSDEHGITITNWPQVTEEF